MDREANSLFINFDDRFDEAGGVDEPEEDAENAEFGETETSRIIRPAVNEGGMANALDGLENNAVSRGGVQHDGATARQRLLRPGTLG